MRSRYTPFLLGLLPIVAILALWWALTAFGTLPRALLPSPQAVFTRTFALLGDDEFRMHIATTLFRLTSGFGIGLSLGLGLALLSVLDRHARALLTALVQLLAPIPKIALYPMLILVLGFDHSSKIALVAAETVFPIYLATFQGLRNVEPKLVWAARAAGASPWQALVFVSFPAALPTILTGCRVALIISCVVVFLSEMISSTEGLGYVLVNAARNFRMTDMFVPIILISTLGLLLSVGFNTLRRRLLTGYPEA